MDWLRDYVAWCLQSIGGWALLAITAAAVLLVLMGVLAGGAALARAFGRGWRSA